MQSQKTIASREKLNYLSQANDSTPQNLAFFVRNIRTPKEYADFVFNLNPIILSMVERNGPSLTGCFPVMAVSHPVTFYRPTVRSLAVDSENLSQESTQMYQFIFAAIRRTDLTNQIQKIRINADTEREARAMLARDFMLVLAGRINPKNNRTFNQHSPLVEVKPESVNIHTLPKSEYVGMIHGTTSINGHRTRKTCGFFMSQIPFNGYQSTADTYQQAEFVARSIRRNKADLFRTNKASRFIAVVEPLPHLTTGYGKPFTNTIKRNPTMKIYSQSNRTLAATATLPVSAEMEVRHA
ncbi:host cell division inhibitor Icd-like protein [Aggregatibacter actinomycetemcomitans]|uniref:host cell division inhibitor Icd-like protein n=1 Tax=Aggregatibacter actinomycetemcomitans TaxID=714 RepID=UPI001E480294|nr:host cell division inhibitor Icd-like protein [Aggregatibacter actinomycetemcomitans]